MSILDSIHQAEEKAEQMRTEARLEARNIVAKAQMEAQAESAGKIDRQRQEYKKKLDACEDKAQAGMRKYLDQKRRENQEIADRARKNLDRAADYIIGKVIG